MKISCALALALACAVPAAAQTGADDAGAVVSAAAGATVMESRTELTLSGSGGYRFNRYVGLEVEITAMPTLKSAFPGSPGDVVIQSGSATVGSSGSVLPGAFIYPAPAYSNFDGRAVLVTNNVRVELPMPSGPLTPFFVAGGGVASVRHTADLTTNIGILTPVGSPLPPGIRTVTEHLTSSSTALALTIGGGVSVRMGSHASIDGDLRFFRLMGASDTNAGRFSVGIRYRF